MATQPKPQRKEIIVQYQIIVRCTENGPETVEIKCDSPAAPFAVIAEAASHLMTIAATKSGIGFEEALELLCQDARANLGGGEGVVEPFRGTHS
jgi:hypothetical protein